MNRFEQLHALLDQKPRANLGFFPTPLVRLDRLSEQLGVNLYVKDKRVMTTGYNGAPSGVKTCVERGECLRKKLGIPSGTRHEMCYAVHAEQNAIIQAAKLGVNIDGSTLYCTHQPCILCAKMIVNAGVVRVVYHSGYPDDFALDIFKEAGVQVECYTESEE